MRHQLHAKAAPRDDLVGQRRDLKVTLRLRQEHMMLRSVGEGRLAHVPVVAHGVDLIPQDLPQLQHHGPVHHALVLAAQEQEEGHKVDAPPQQDRVVLAGYPQRRAGHLLRQRHIRRAIDAALAVPRVVLPALVDLELQRPDQTDLGAIRRRQPRVDGQRQLPDALADATCHGHLLEHALVQMLGDDREVFEVEDHLADGGDLVVGHTRPVRRKADALVVMQELARVPGGEL